MNHDFNPVGGDGLFNYYPPFFNRRPRYPTATTASQQLPTTMASSPPNALPTRPATWGAVPPLKSQSPVTGSPIHQPSTPQQPHDETHTQSPVNTHASPLPHHSPFQPTSTVSSQSVLTDWLMQGPQMMDPSFVNFTAFSPTVLPALDYNIPATNAPFDPSTTLPMESAFTTMSPMEDPTVTMVPWPGTSWGHHDFEANTMLSQMESLPRMNNMATNSPSNTVLEIMPQNSPGSESWTMIQPPNLDFGSPTGNGSIFNPGQTLHLRTISDASGSDGYGTGFEEVFPVSPYSPGSDIYLDCGSSPHSMPGSSPTHSHPELVSPSTNLPPVPIVKPTSGPGNTTPPRRNSGGPRKSPSTKNTTKVIRRTLSNKKDGNGEKKVGRRRGPLLPEQRKQASEIRKLRACLRCKFLKKTCDKGEPCAGCQPSHARLWQVPCTRIDIKDISYFLNGWKADFERHMDRGVSIFNVKGFGSRETTMWLTHGYGAVVAVPVREVFVADDRVFNCDWVESWDKEQSPIDFASRTEHLDVGQEGLSTHRLTEYIEQHIDEHFDTFIKDHFEGTPFITELLLTAHKYYRKTRSEVIRKALKLVVAYNLTLHITMVEGTGSESPLSGQIDDEDSKYFGKILAPTLVNFQVKVALADIWRQLHKEVLEELSSLYSSVYSGDRLKNWPTIFMLASILLTVWEEMQFDCHYRTPDPDVAKKFCTDMETTPVGVIVGLFHAISQKLPALSEWNTATHGHVLNNEPSICQALTEVKGHIIQHDSYLRTRNDAKFDRYDFDSLSNKFLSKLVIRSN